MQRLQINKGQVTSTHPYIFTIKGSTVFNKIKQQPNKLNYLIVVCGFQRKHER